MQTVDIDDLRHYISTQSDIARKSDHTQDTHMSIFLDLDSNDEASNLVTEDHLV